MFIFMPQHTSIINKITYTILIKKYFTLPTFVLVGSNLNI